MTCKSKDSLKRSNIPFFQISPHFGESSMHCTCNDDEKTGFMLGLCFTILTVIKAIILYNHKSI